MRAVPDHSPGDIGKPVIRRFMVIEVGYTCWLTLYCKNCIELGITPWVIIKNAMIKRIKNIDLGFVPCAVAREALPQNTVAQEPVGGPVFKAMKIVQQEPVVKISDGDAERSIVRRVCDLVIFFSNAFSD